MELFSVRVRILAGVFFHSLSEKKRGKGCDVWWFLCHSTSGVFCLQNTMDGNVIFVKLAKEQQVISPADITSLMRKVTMDLYCYQKLKQGWGSCFVFVFKGNPNRIIFHNVAVKRFILQITPNKFSIHKTCPLLWPMWPLAYWITSGPLL